MSPLDSIQTAELARSSGGRAADANAGQFSAGTDLSRIIPDASLHIVTNADGTHVTAGKNFATINAVTDYRTTDFDTGKFPVGTDFAGFYATALQIATDGHGSHVAAGSNYAGVGIAGADERTTDHNAANGTEHVPTRTSDGKESADNVGGHGKLAQLTLDNTLQIAASLLCGCAKATD